MFNFLMVFYLVMSMFCFQDSFYDDSKKPEKEIFLPHGEFLSECSTVGDDQQSGSTFIIGGVFKSVFPPCLLLGALFELEG